MYCLAIEVFCCYVFPLVFLLVLKSASVVVFLVVFYWFRDRRLLLRPNVMIPFLLIIIANAVCMFVMANDGFSRPNEKDYQLVVLIGGVLSLSACGLYQILPNTYKLSCNLSCFCGFLNFLYYSCLKTISASESIIIVAVCVGVPVFLFISCISNRALVKEDFAKTTILSSLTMLIFGNGAMGYWLGECNDLKFIVAHSVAFLALLFLLRARVVQIKEEEIQYQKGIEKEKEEITTLEPSSESNQIDALEGASKDLAIPISLSEEEEIMKGSQAEQKNAESSSPEDIEAKLSLLVESINQRSNF